MNFKVLVCYFRNITFLHFVQASIVSLILTTKILSHNVMQNKTKQQQIERSQYLKYQVVYADLRQNIIF